MLQGCYKRIMQMAHQTLPKITANRALYFTSVSCCLFQLMGRIQQLTHSAPTPSAHSKVLPFAVDTQPLTIGSASPLPGIAMQLAAAVP